MMINMHHSKKTPSNAVIRLFSSICATSVLISATLTSTSAAAQDNQDVVQALNALGLNADSMACIDVIENEPTVVLDRLNNEFNDYEHYVALQQNIADHQRTAYQSKAILRDHANNTDAQSALELAQTQITLLSNEAASVKIALINTILDGLADANLISPVIEAQGAMRLLPPAYRIAVGTADEAKTLAWALKKQETTQENNTPLNSEASQAINSAHAQFDVQHAIVRVNTYGDQNQAQIDAWVIGH